MKAKKVPAVRIDYPKHWFTLGTMIWVLGTILLAYLAYDSVEESIRLFWFIATVFEAVVMFYMFVLPMFTYHSAGAKGLRLRMGLLIRDTIPYDWIKEVRETSIHWGGVRVGIGVRYAPIMKTMFVTSSFTTLVSIKLDGDHRLGGLIKRPVKEVVLSVKSATSFIDLMMQRTGMEKV